MAFRILAIGDIVGAPGRAAVHHLLPALRQQHELDFVVANAENAAGGMGVTPEIARELLASGVNVLTTGDHVWARRELIPYLSQEPRLLRPANYAPGAAGRGWGVVQAAEGTPVGVVNLLGRIFMQPVDSPFQAVQRALSEIGQNARIVLVDFHAEATSEKIALGWMLDGRVTAVLGTHTHVQTADECIRPGGTAYISDLGMTGPHESVIGRKIEPVVSFLVHQMPQRFDVATGDVRLCGAIITADPQTGRATAIERLVLPDTAASQQRVQSDAEAAEKLSGDGDEPTA